MLKTRKIQCKVVLVLFGLFLAAPAGALEVDRGGYGDALLVPYFDVNNLNTLLSIESNNFMYQVVRVRFRSATSGTEALAFTLCLAPAGSWTAAMVSTGTTAQIVSGSSMLADRKSTRLNSSHSRASRMPSSA